MVTRLWCKEVVEQRIGLVRKEKGDDAGLIDAAAPAVLDLLSSYAQVFVKVVTAEANDLCIDEKTKGQSAVGSNVRRLKPQHVHAALRTLEFGEYVQESASVTKKRSKAKKRKRRPKWKDTELEALAAEQEQLFKRARLQHGEQEDQHKKQE